MAPERPARSSMVIDLTLSDDEDNSLRPHPLRPVDPGDFFSHDGLPIYNTTPAPIRPPIHFQAPRPLPAMQNNQYTNGNSSTARRSLGQTSVNEISRQGNDNMHAAKRRKTDNGSSQYIPRPPILPPIPEYKKKGALPALPLRRTVIDGATREESSKSRISPKGKIQKPVPVTKPGRIRETAKIVQKSLAKHKGSLSAKQLKEIGTKVLKKLLDPSYFSESTTDAENFSADYSNFLTRRSQDYSDRMVSEALVVKQSSFSSRTSSPQISSLSHQAPKVPRSSIASDSSDVDDDIFESSIQRPSRRNYSSSPTTSLDQMVEAEGVKSIITNTRDRTEKMRRPGKPIPSRRIRLKPSLWDKKPTQRQTPVPVPLQRKVPVVEIPRFNPSKFKHVIIPEPLRKRPYLGYRDREALRLGLERTQVIMLNQDQENLKIADVHHDLSLEELKIVYIGAKGAKNEPVNRVDLDARLPTMVMSLMTGSNPRLVATILDNIRLTFESGAEDKGIDLLRRRGDSAIIAFLQDAIAGKINTSPHILRLDVKAKRKTALRFSSLLMQRESGLATSRIRSGKESFQSRATSLLEDGIVRQSEWTDCCGDISTITWTGKTTFICGATAHSDYHNMQYNKPGNLAVGSTALDTLRAVSNHRVTRPEIAHEDNAENALQSMRNTQDAWLYTSVVSTAYSPMTGLAFTASFDQTVKVWSVGDGSQMILHDAWYHLGKVNFVVSSDHHSRVATACDITLDAVRVYYVNPENITTSDFVSFCGERARAQGQAGPERQSEKWAYFPATIQWGKAASVSHLLLVGFSPRSLTGDDQDIPEDKRDTGELCLWDVDDGTEIPITSAKLQNVFEVLWHPTQPIFLAATSPCGSYEPMQTKTQIRMFGQTPTGTFMHLKALDCPALDINELTIFPNCRLHSYVTASCTDGNTYVYDSALGDQAIHILKHGESLDNPLHDIDREQGDTGVKFAAWGQNKNRFYTGASDGKVKAWDITQSPRHAFVRDVLVVSGGVSAGAFSKDYSQLLIGDATGKIHLLSIDDNDIEEPVSQPLNALQNGRHLLENGGLLPSGLKRPKVLIPHPEPTPPRSSQRVVKPSTTPKVDSGPEIARQLVEEGIITINADPWIGATQGPKYYEANLFRYEAHEGQDGTAPLLSDWQRKQRSFMYRPSEGGFQIGRLEEDVTRQASIQSLEQHKLNLELDIDISKLSLETKIQMGKEGGWEVNGDFNWDFNAEEEGPGEEFEIFKVDAVGNTEEEEEESDYQIESKMQIEREMLFQRGRYSDL